MNDVFEFLLDSLEPWSERGMALRAQRSKRIGKELPLLGLVSDTVTLNQSQTLSMTERMLFHRVQDFVLIILRYTRKAESAGRADFSLTKGRLPLDGKFGYQSDSLDDPAFLMFKYCGDCTHRHLVIGHQGMRNASFVERRDGPLW